VRPGPQRCASPFTATANPPARPRPSLRSLCRLAAPATLLAASLIPAFFAAPAAQAQAPAAAPAETLCQPQVLGNRRIPKETILARMFSHAGDVYDPVTVERDFNSLWNTGYFEDVRIEREDTPRCVQLIVVVREKPTIREINYKGLSSISQSDLLDRFKKEKVGLSQESQYDFEKVAHARAVLLQVLGEHGHQFAKVTVDIKNIPPAAVSINFIIKEGPTVKVGRIKFTGNTAIPPRILRSSMVNLRPIGIPHSIIFENLFARTYDQSKLEEDTEHVLYAFRDRGYFRAEVGDPETHIRDDNGFSFLTFRPKHGKRIDITIPITQGGRYRLAAITFHGNKAATNTKALRSLFPQKDGEYFDSSLVGKGLDNLRKAYGQLGYINFSAVPTPKIDEAKKSISLDIDIDEGKPFYVGRIEFQGNTTTRDKVIRRELLLEEGQVYNSHLWELSILRLNQLNYFNPLKIETDSETHQDQDNGTVDLLLKVTEKGKNSIGLNGGISGLSGAFIGTQYQTNNFLGLGETLSISANLGNLARNIQFGFTEPYFRDRPISLGFTLFTSKYDYNEAKNYQATSGSPLNFSQSQLNLIQNYNQNTTGGNISVAYAIPRSFKRIGITYGYNTSNIQAFSQASSNLFQTLAFRGISSQNALNGIRTSQLTPSFVYSTVDNPLRPHSGKAMSIAGVFAGAGGNVRYVSPVFEYKQFRPMTGLHFARDGKNVLGYRVQATYITGFGGQVAPPFNRIYGGGENEIRGFDVRSITPYAFVPTRVLMTLWDGISCVPVNSTQPSEGCVQVPVPTYTIGSVGGDANFVNNLEYRIPIAGPVDFKLFNDFGLDFIVKKSQLRQTTEGFYALQSALYGCPDLVGGTCKGGVTEHFEQQLQILHGTNFIPRDSIGAEVGVILPVVNAPFRVYYAYNPLRLKEFYPGSCPLPDVVNPAPPPSFAAPCLIQRSLFPTGGAGDFTFNQAVHYYGQSYYLREPRKTFRFTVSTTF
jgi:outer membrane protein insertion porin family